MKILTTNAAGSDVFGGIHTRKTEQVRYSPQHSFHVIELNREKKYSSEGKNLNVYKLDIPRLTAGKTIFELLKSAKNLSEFEVSVERIVNEFQNTIRDVEPDAVLIPGTSLTSYFLFKAARREGILEKVVQEYAGILEKEISNYTGETRFILSQLGKKFVSEKARNSVTYIFPSNIAKEAVENIHGIKLNNYSVIWNGVSAEFFEGGFKRSPPKDLVLGYVGRMQHVKNLPFFLSLNENLNYNAKLKLITDITGASKRDSGTTLLQKLTAEEVFYYAPRNKTRLKSFYEEKLSALVVPSFFETFCNCAVESTVCGTPVLLSDRAGASEVYRKYGLEELIFSIEDISSFEDSLSHARKINFRISEGLSRQIYSDLNWEKTIKKYNQVLEDAVKKT